LVVVDTDRQTDGTVRVLREIRKAAARIHNVAVVAEMILAGFRTALVWDRAWWTVFPAGATRIAELRDAGIDRVIGRELDRRNHAAHAEQRTERRMNDRPVPAQFAE